MWARVVGARAALAFVLAASLAGGFAASPVGAASDSAERVRLPFPRYDGTLTPYTFELGYPLVTLVYDTLMWRDRAGVPRPWLARSVRRSPDGRTVTIALRRGIRWQDGWALTASDVAFTFRFVAERFHPRFTPQLSAVERVDATGPLTVTIRLRRPSAGFLDQPLADLPILPEHIWRDLPSGQAAPPGRPIGSGPYRLTSASPREGYRFQAYDGYFRGRPAVARIEVPIVRQADRTYTALERRRVDMLPISLPEDAATELGGAFGIDLRRGASYTGTALLLNLRQPPFDRPAMRRAVADALDLERIVRNVGDAVPADRGYIHPASPWASGRILHRFDASAARSAFAQLAPPQIHVLAPDNDPVRLEAGRQVVLSLTRAGVQATLARRSRSELGGLIGEDGSTPVFQAAVVGTPALASYDPDFLMELFGSDRRRAPLNYTGYRSGTFEALAGRTAVTTDRKARRRAVRAELRLLARDLPAIPLFFPEGTFAYRPASFDGWVYVKGAGILDKRSFLPRQRSADRQAVVESQAEDSDDSGTTVLDVLRIGSLLVLVAALVVAATALFHRARSRV